MTDIFTIVMISLGFLATFFTGMFIELIRHTRRLNKGPYDGLMIFGKNNGVAINMNIPLETMTSKGYLVLGVKYIDGEVTVDNGETTEKDLIHM